MRGESTTMEVRLTDNGINVIKGISNVRKLPGHKVGTTTPKKTDKELSLSECNAKGCFCSGLDKLTI